MVSTCINLPVGIEMIVKRKLYCMVNSRDIQAEIPLP